MNVPEYRQAVHDAQDKFEKTVIVASEVMRKELMQAESRFFEEQPVEARRDYPDEDIAVARRK